MILWPKVRTVIRSNQRSSCARSPPEFPACPNQPRRDQVNRAPAQLDHADVKGRARAQTRLFKYHCELLAGQQACAMPRSCLRFSSSASCNRPSNSRRLMPSKLSKSRLFMDINDADWLLAGQHFFQDRQTSVDFVLLDRQRRHEAQHFGRRAIHQQALEHARFGDLAAFDLKLDADEQPLAANIADKRKTFFQTPRAL